MSKIRFKEKGQIKEIQGKLATGIYINDIELYDGDKVLWLNGNVQCEVCWSKLFNGWCIVNFDNISLGEIPIGHYGIQTIELTLI